MACLDTGNAVRWNGRMKAILRLRLLSLMAVLTTSVPLSSCYTTQPPSKPKPQQQERRDELSPLAPQWTPFLHHRS